MSSDKSSIITHGLVIPLKGSSGSWSCALLLKRMLLVLVADKMNLLLLCGQPVLIALLISYVATKEPSITKKLFLGNIAVMWMACSNAAQVIVKERTIVLRERLAGLWLKSYVLSKFIGMGFISTMQSWLLLGLLCVTGKGLADSPWGLAGDPWLLFMAFTGTALTLTGIGIVISAGSKSPTQAALAVPLVIIPLILLSGFVFPLKEWTNRPVVALVSWLSPSYAAQRLVDMGLLWDREILGSEFNRMRLDPHMQNLELSLVPWSVWLSHQPDDQQEMESKEYEVDASTAQRIYAPNLSPEAPPLEPMKYAWPLWPKFESGRFYHHTEACRQPLMLFGIWICICYVASLVILGRIKSH